MRLTRVYVDAPLATGATVALPDNAARHVAQVLRLQTGSALRVFNGAGGEFDATLNTMRRDKADALVGTHHAIERESPLQITLLQGIARGEKMDLILQKSTELGVTRIVPVTMVRSTVRLDARTAQRKQEHWRSIVASACEQCGRNRLPLVDAPLSLAEALDAVSTRPGLLLAPDDHSASLPALLQEAGGDTLRAISLLVGPEGGFDPTEEAMALTAGYTPCRLGPRVLRTETAALTALAALQSLLGDLT